MTRRSDRPRWFRLAYRVVCCTLGQRRSKKNKQTNKQNKQTNEQKQTNKKAIIVRQAERVSGFHVIWVETSERAHISQNCYASLNSGRKIAWKKQRGRATQESFATKTTRRCTSWENRLGLFILFKPKLVFPLVGWAVVGHSARFDNLPYPSPHASSHVYINKF